MKQKAVFQTKNKPAASKGEESKELGEKQAPTKPTPAVPVKKLATTQKSPEVGGKEKVLQAQHAKPVIGASSTPNPKPGQPASINSQLHEVNGLKSSQVPTNFGAPQIPSHNPGPVTTVVQVNTTVVTPPCCGTLCVSIIDFFITSSPTVVLIAIASGLSGYGAVKAAYFPGLLTCLLAIGSIVCSCGQPSKGKLSFLVCYKWFRLVFFSLLLLVSVGLIIMYFVVAGSANSGNGSVDTVLKLFLFILLVMALAVFFVPGLIMACTHYCYARDVAVKSQVVAQTLNSMADTSQVMPLVQPAGVQKIGH
jgi:hypothetical protein